MFKALLLSLISVCILLCAGCKSGGTDNTSNWIGVYTTSHPGDTLNTLIITKSSDNSLRVEIKATQSGYLYTYSTLQNVSVTSMTQAVINEDDNITGGSGPYHVQGTLTLTGTNITLAATATQGTIVNTLNFSGPRH